MYTCVHASELSIIWVFNTICLIFITIVSYSRVQYLKHEGLNMYHICAWICVWFKMCFTDPLPGCQKITSHSPVTMLLCYSKVKPAQWHNDLVPTQSAPSQIYCHHGIDNGTVFQINSYRDIRKTCIHTTRVSHMFRYVQIFLIILLINHIDCLLKK